MLDKTQFNGLTIKLIIVRQVLEMRLRRTCECPTAGSLEICQVGLLFSSFNKYFSILRKHMYYAYFVLILLIFS